MRKLLPAALTALLLLCACGSPQTRAPAKATPPATDADVLRPPEQKATSPTLRKVRARGKLICGVAGDLVGFSSQDSRGDWRGFDVDVCRAVAAAVLGDARLVTFTPLDVRTRFAALQSGAVDLLARNTAWTFSRDAALGVEFAGVSYYDTQGFLVLRSLNLQTAQDLARRRICVVAGTSQLTLADYFRARDINYTPVPAETDAAARLAYERNDCDVLTGDVTALAAARTVLARPSAYLILNEAVAKEPLGPIVREGDDAWAGIVRWTLNSLILAEELKVTSQTAPADRRSKNPEVRRLLGEDGAFGALMGLREDWAYRAIHQVGAYGEIFDRNLGPATPLKLERGLNALWNAEPRGLMYSPPMR